ncbi:MAG: hypothetical protein M1831_002685 [Alyxoria varia]|nr:MAG: hypothetical protein M1831_002685 [Alyxoria varia]
MIPIGVFGHTAEQDSFPDSESIQLQDLENSIKKKFDGARSFRLARRPFRIPHRRKARQSLSDSLVNRKEEGEEEEAEEGDDDDDKNPIPAHPVVAVPPKHEFRQYSLDATNKNNNNNDDNNNNDNSNFNFFGSRQNPSQFNTASSQPISWQFANPSTDHQQQQQQQRFKGRHVEIVIPAFAPPHLSLYLPETPSTAVSRLGDFPSPPSVTRSSEQTSIPETPDTEISDDPSREASRISCRDWAAFASKVQRGFDLTTPAMMNGHGQDSTISRDQDIQGGDGANANASTSATSHPHSSSSSTAVPPAATTTSNNLSSLVCDVHRTTGEKPPALVGASTTISGDRLFVFGGRRLSRRKTQLTQDLYELDLIRRHWVRLKTYGSQPAPRYFHSVCALGDTKLVCYGGMAPTSVAKDPQQDSSGGQQQSEPGVTVMSDVHVYDIGTQFWTSVAAPNPPPGRYAHCAAILPSSAVFTSDSAPRSAIQHNPASPNPNQGSLGVTIDGRGGAEMVVVGGQDGASRYIEQISVFNLRSLKWTSTTNLGRSCGAYRSVVTPLVGMRPSQIGDGPVPTFDQQTHSDEEDESSADSGFATLIYSNYNFLDVKLELQVCLADGSLVEKPMKSVHSPPGLRFPNGEIINNHFVVSGTFLTSTRQEYALWALNLKTLTWNRIDTGPGILTSGSWNRGVLWKKRNTFVILGDRRRSLAEDYNHRRLNFSNMCTVELEAYGLYDNPITNMPWSFPSASAPIPVPIPPLHTHRPSCVETNQSLGRSASEMREAADMDLLAMGGERISVNSHVIARRWGPYLINLLEANSGIHENGIRPGSDRMGVGMEHASRNSSITITPGSINSFSHSMTDAFDNIAGKDSTANRAPSSLNSDAMSIEHVAALSPSARSRLLYLPHTYFTIRALVFYLYTWSLPPQGSPLCTPQILCSLLQLARPYRINGLLEATVERLHQVLDGRNTAAIFNAAAMAAGGGEGISFAGDLSVAERRQTARAATQGASLERSPNPPPSRGRGEDGTPLEDSEDERGGSVSSSAASSFSGVESGTEEQRPAPEIWAGEVSAVIGLQKRGLRGLMEGRKLRERGGNVEEPPPPSAAPNSALDGSGVGLGIG